MRYRVLGALAVGDAARPDQTPRGARQRLLLACLLAAGGQAVSADRLAEELWGDDALPDNPTGALQTQISRLRRELGPASIATEPGGYRLTVDPEDVDARCFDELLDEAAVVVDAQGSLTLLDEALGLWRGSAYGELADRPSILAEAVRLEERRATAAEDRAEGLLAMGRLTDAVAAAADLAVEAPLRERPQGLLMRALHASGRSPEALEVYGRFRRLLGDELGLEPSPALAELEGRILRHEPVADSDPDARGKGPTAVPRRLLGPPPTTFVGREADLAGVLQRLATGRMVTVCGTGGVGKTRLALEVITRAAPGYRDGAAVLELAAVARGADLATAVATSLGIPERSEASVADRLVEALADRHLLLVLDNCEHVVDEAAALVEPLLRTAGGVDILATSRSALGLTAEQVWPLAPLAADGPGAPAARLFGDRARAARPDLEVEDSDAALVHRLCRRLDGIPLALELAAARLRVTGLAELFDAVESGDDALASPRPSGVGRHRSLESLVAWSLGLLSAEEQTLFARLSVFRSEFTIEAAASVASGDGLPWGSVAPALWSLVEQSLIVRRDTPGGVRYALLETMRDAGSSRLEAQGHAGTCRRRHADLVLAVAADAESDAQGPEAVQAVVTIEALIPEARAAMDHLRQSRDVDGSLRLASSVFWFGFSRISPEVLGWAISAVELADQEGVGGDPRLPGVIGVAATGCWQRGDLARARYLGERGVEAARRQGHPPGALRAYEALIDVRMFEGDIAEALRWAYAAQAVLDATTRPIDEVYAHLNVAFCHAYDGRPEEAVAPTDAALAVADASGSLIAQAWALYGAGEVRLESQPEAALELLDRSLAAAREVGERMIMGVAGLSALSLRLRLNAPNPEDGLAYRHLIEHWRQVGAWTQQWTTLRNLAELLARRGEDRLAAQLLAAARASRTAPPSWGAEAGRLEAVEAALRLRLGGGYDDEVAAGRRLGDDGAVGLGLVAADRLSQGGGRLLRTLLFTDVVASAEALERMGDHAWRSLLDRHDDLVRAAVADAGGDLVATTGDGVLAAFVEPAPAVACARAVLAEVHRLGLQVRAGLHAGECIRRGDDLAGRTVHVAARVLAEADADEVLLTRTVKDLLGGADVPLVPRGIRRLRGLDDDWELFAVR